MKLRSFFTSILASVALIGCVQEELPGLSEIAVTPSYFTMGVDGGTKEVKVTSSAAWEVTGEVPAWVTLSALNGNGSAEGETVTVTVAASTDPEARTAYLNFTCAGETQLVTVNQNAFKPAYPDFEGGEYWIMTADKSSVVFPIDDGGNGYGYMNVVKATDGKSTAANIYTFTAVEGETNGFTIVDTKGQYHIGSTYNSFTVSTTNPADGSEVWYVKQVGDDSFEIISKKNGWTIFMSTYGNFCPYPAGHEKSTGELPNLVSAAGEEAVEIMFAVEPKEVSLEKAAGEFEINMTCKNEGFEINPSASWIVVKGMTSKDGEYVVTFTYEENPAAARTATIDFVSGEETITVEVSQAGDIADATVAEFLAAEVGPALYRLTGRVTNLKTGDYGNFHLVDATGSVYVYGLTATPVEKNDKSFPTLGIREGDVVTLIGTRDRYDNAKVENEKEQVGGPAYYVSHVSSTDVTVAEFLTKEKSADAWYRLTGIIEEIVKEEYGNFYLNDGTARVYVYGLTAAPVAKNDKTFASLGLKVGDVVTLVGTRDRYDKASVEDQKDQVGGPAYYVSHEEGAPAVDPWETAAVAVNGAEATDDARLKELKAYADANYLYVRLTATKETPFGADYLDFFFTDGEGETEVWWGWTTTGTDIYYQEHKCELNENGELTKMRWYPVEGDRVYIDDYTTTATDTEVCWEMKFPRSYVDVYKSSTGKTYLSFLLWNGWDAYWAIPARYNAMLEVTLP